MKLSAAVEALLTATMADGRSKRTVEYYRGNLAHLVDFLGDVDDVATLTIHDLRRYAAELRGREERFKDHPNMARKAGGLSPFSVATYLRAVRRLFNWLVEEGVIETSPAERLKIQTPRRIEPKGLSIDDLVKLLQATEGDDIEQIRDRAIVILLADTGIRAGGLTHLKLDSVDFEGRTILVHEKGELQRRVPFSDGTYDALQRWLPVRPNVAGVDWLFVNLGHRKKETRLTEDALGEVMRRLRVAAGVTAPVSPHRFRHTFAREYLRNGGDISSLSKMLGHSSPMVTLRFYAIYADAELGAFHAKYSPVARMMGLKPTE